MPIVHPSDPHKSERYRGLLRPLEIEKTWESVAKAEKEVEGKWEKRRFVVEYQNQYFCLTIGWCDKLDRVLVPAPWYWVEGCKDNTYRVHMLKNEVLPEGKTCLIKNVLPMMVIRMLEMQPENPTFRALALSHLAIPIPNNKKTWAEVKDWIETNIDQDKVRERTDVEL